ncbi:hypothetical protein PTTG_06129 [Puccinia triticina 1-1 BBBD Race 1]|uniref:Retrotransposon gag domain-containing protein n=1 Tax=Puccinia triticina (isolate 1-1 / race 1 (BBBD)) TaxID=630390 RepID=A0A180GI32_PUCT1|nr:hypothetical protein PTTG_06129 [Puccinia triticina 1-1 BBBD Race 1]
MPIDGLKLIAELHRATMDLQRTPEFGQHRRSQKIKPKRTPNNLLAWRKPSYELRRNATRRLQHRQTPQTTRSTSESSIHQMGPSHVGPYQETKPFLAWIHSLEIFFDTKKVNTTKDKVRIAGTFIKETNLLSFYLNEAKKHLTGLWEDFKSVLFNAALPVRWRHGLRKKIQGLKMESSESFAQCETRARTLQRMINFDSDPPVISDLSLAEWLTGGLPDDLQGEVFKFEILEADPFDYNRFAKQVRIFVNAQPKRSANNCQRNHARNTSPNASSATDTKPTGAMSEELRWRIHSYLDSVGRCHWCRDHCGSNKGSCPNPRDCNRVIVPSLFRTPPKLAEYSPPQAWTSAKGPGSRNQNSNAGRVTSRQAGVAAVDNEQEYLFPKMDQTSTAAMNEVDKIMAHGFEDDEDVITEETKLVAVKHFEALRGFEDSLSSRISEAIAGTEEGYVPVSSAPLRTPHLLRMNDSRPPSTTALLQKKTSKGAISLRYPRPINYNQELI